MNRYYIITLLFIFIFSFNNSAFAQDKDQNSQDPFDLSSINSKIEEIGVPTQQDVQKLRSEAIQYFTTQNYEKAIPALKAYAKNANWLANIISAGLEPYYGASYDDRDNFSYHKAKPLVSLEEKANDLRAQRNKAFVMQAECYIKTGDTQKAVALYIKALDLISLDNEKLWERARDGLFDVINVSED